MRSINAPRTWPPHSTDELRCLLSNRQDVTRDSQAGRHPSLKLALDELQAWIKDPRPYDHHHKRPWQSLIADLQAALKTRGTALTEATPSLNDLTGELLRPGIAANKHSQLACDTLVQQAREQLQQPSSAVAAVNDVYSAVQKGSTLAGTVDSRMQALDATLGSANRSLEAEGRMLASVLDDTASQIAWARHHLYGTTVVEGGHWDDAAGLSSEERLHLCRLLLLKPVAPGDQVVWITYGNARLSRAPSLHFGPVTFFDGPELLRALKEKTKNPATAAKPHQDLPRELAFDNEATLSNDSSSIWPPETEPWVAVRIELEPGRAYADPVGTAQDQADALVRLASFHGQGTSWKAYSGHRHYINGAFRAGTYPIGPDLDHTLLRDVTDAQLEVLRHELAQHLPAQDPQLHELLQAARALDSSASADAATSLLQDVRIVELIATRCGNKNWQQQLSANFAVRWARSQILQELYGSVMGVLTDHTMHVDRDFLKRQDLQKLVPGSTDRYIGNFDVCLEFLPQLAAMLPDHNRAARRLRTTNHRLRSNGALEAWVKELTAEYVRLVARLARCRDALAHGGPVELGVANTIHRFSNTQAKCTTSLGLWAVVVGNSVTDAHTNYSREGDDWRRGIAAAPSMKEALNVKDTLDPKVQ